MSAEDMLQSILQQIFKMTSLCADAGPEIASPLGSRLIDNSLLYAGPDLSQTLLQFPNSVHHLLVYTLLYTSLDAVVDRIQVRAVCWPEFRQNKCWCLLAQ